MNHHQFTEYLRETLIPDLRTSDMDATADDFETCLRMLDESRATLEALHDYTRERVSEYRNALDPESDALYLRTHYALKGEPA